MSSFFGRLKGSANPASPSLAAQEKAKKDLNVPPPTPLEKLLVDAGPLRTDGSDKFFGFENFGSTCYCNSIVQCLYYSHAFREHVINFPKRIPADSLNRASSGLPQIDSDTGASNGGPPPPLKGNPPVTNTVGPPRAKPATTTATGPGGQPKEENKDSSEYKKKLLMDKGPIVAMDYENSKAYGMNESLFSCLKDIFEAIIAHPSRMGVVSPQKFLEVLRRENEMFRTPMHQDAHEFLNLLLNEVVENVEQFSKQMAATVQKALANDMTAPELKTPTVVNSNQNSINGTGWVHDLFEGLLTSETRCLTCENLSQRDEAFLDLSVDLEQHSSVTSCLRKFSEEEMLCERNKFHCDNCGGLQEAEKRMKVKRLPRILALHLKRFKYTEDLQRLQKLFHRVVYPYHLRLFNTTDDAEDPDRLYELYAVVVHLGGGPYHGHYVSIIKTQDRGWLLFDDELVEPVDQSYVTNFFGGEGQLACAYVLFYQETTLEAVQREQEAQGTPPAATAAESSAPPKNMPNGSTHPHGVPLSHTPATPLPEDIESPLNPLAHAATVPSTAHIPGAPLSPTPTSPATTTTPRDSSSHTPHSNHLLSPLRSKKSLHTLSTKPKPSKDDIRRSKDFERVRKEDAKREKSEEKAREKDRRDAEREAYLAEKQRRKDVANDVVERRRIQEEEFQKALKISKMSKKEDDDRRKLATVEERGEVVAKAMNGDISRAVGDGQMVAGAGVTAQDGKGGVKSGGLHRFRQTSMSMSLRHKPKFWGGKEKEKEKEKNQHDAPSSSTGPSSTTSTSHTQPPMPPLSPVHTDPGRLSHQEPSLDHVRSQPPTKDLPPLPPPPPLKSPVAPLRHARSQSYTLDALARRATDLGNGGLKKPEKEKEKEKEKKSRFGLGKKKSMAF
ncbi:cysteine proteinase [Eremomyces bilateralis CBS 781.70]|uniref:Ubiquitin carboxyl-terminal hydrolase n=1 Tax=Eremomyces bilateralis CBS 781.70 TaxID=1392243 RepID=A0A6G1FXX6_9PEZI|nr:cysteine proteinase [Eremomyces bilateralis CBS 781.70]KAF1810541.1 cysteine proteinase [Eremomyces bilateralis CBS 781.70]